MILGQFGRYTSQDNRFDLDEFEEDIERAWAEYVQERGLEEYTGDFEEDFRIERVYAPFKPLNNNSKPYTVIETDNLGIAAADDMPGIIETLSATASKLLHGDTGTRYKERRQGVDVRGFGKSNIREESLDRDYFLVTYLEDNLEFRHHLGGAGNMELLWREVFLEDPANF